MVDLNERLFLGILSAVGIGLLSWLAVLARSKTRELWDRRKVYTWLHSNTRDQIGESHVDTATVAKGTRLPEERVRPRVYVRQTHPSFPEAARTVERLAQGAAERLRE